MLTVYEDVSEKTIFTPGSNADEGFPSRGFLLKCVF